MEATHGLADEDAAARRRSLLVFEVRILRVHLEDSILVDGDPNRIDPDKWRPLIMSFQRFYGLEANQVQDSKLAQIPEHLYPGPDIDRARKEPTLQNHE